MKTFSFWKTSKIVTSLNKKKLFVNECVFLIKEFYFDNFKPKYKGRAYNKLLYQIAIRNPFKVKFKNKT